MPANRIGAFGVIGGWSLLCVHGSADGAETADEVTWRG